MLTFIHFLKLLRSVIQSAWRTICLLQDYSLTETLKVTAWTGHANSPNPKKKTSWPACLINSQPYRKWKIAIIHDSWTMAETGHLKKCYSMRLSAAEALQLCSPSAHSLSQKCYLSAIKEAIRAPASLLLLSLSGAAASDKSDLTLTTCSNMWSNP